MASALGATLRSNASWESPYAPLLAEFRSIDAASGRRRPQRPTPRAVARSGSEGANRVMVMLIAPQGRAMVQIEAIAGLAA
jgi:hypothetical protein